MIAPTRVALYASLAALAMPPLAGAGAAVAVAKRPPAAIARNTIVRTPSAGWSIPVPTSHAYGAPEMLLDPTMPAPPDSTGPSSRDFSIAPSVDNIFNRRHDIQDDIGGPGSANGYLRSVPRTFGFAIKKALY